jgi:ABC-type sugar transport system substrate-binding protein
MSKKIFTAAIFSVFAMGLVLMPFSADHAQAADKIGWVGPVYKELSDSLTKGFKAITTKRPTARTVDITFRHARADGRSAWTKSRLWGGKPDADIFLGAGAPAHEVA